MKKLLIALATTVALVGPAAAGSPSMPPQFRGTWCDGGSDRYVQASQLLDWERADLKCESKMTATTWSNVEWTCKLTKITNGNLPEGEFTCPENKKLRFSFGRGNGGSKTPRLYIRGEQ